MYVQFEIQLKNLFLTCFSILSTQIAKAFAMHAGLRPCARCKSNKQGAFHCRLRRKHRDLDYDGGNSAKILETIKNTKLTT